MQPHHPVKRSERVALLLQEEISSILLRGIKDPLVGMASISKVEVSDDLKTARVFVSAIGTEQERRNSVEGLKRARPFVRALLRKRVKLKVIPELSFVLDTSYEARDRIERLLDEIRLADQPEQPAGK